MDDIRKKVLVFEQSNTLAHAYELAFLGSDWELILVEDESLLLQISAEEMPDVIVVEQSRISDETLSQLTEVGFALLCSGCRELQEPFLGLLPRPFSVTELFPVLQSTMEKSLTQANDADECETPTEENNSADEGITEDTFSPEAFADNGESHEVEIIEDDDDDDDDLLVVGEDNKEDECEVEEDGEEGSSEIEVEGEKEECDVEITQESGDDDTEIEFETEEDECEPEEATLDPEGIDTEIEIEEDSEIEIEADDDSEIEIEEDSEIEIEADDDTEIEIEESADEECEEPLESEEDEELMEFGSDDVVSLTAPPVEESANLPADEVSPSEAPQDGDEVPVAATAPETTATRDAVSAIVQDELRTMIKELLWEMAPDIIKQTVEEKITELYQQKNQ